MPITQDYFDDVIGDVDRQAATLKRIAALGRQQAKRTYKTGESGQAARENLRHAHQRALAINASFEDFIRPLVFTDHSAHQVVAKTKTSLHKAVREISDAMRLIEASYRHARDRARCAAPAGRG